MLNILEFHSQVWYSMVYEACEGCRLWYQVLSGNINRRERRYKKKPGITMYIKSRHITTKKQKNPAEKHSVVSGKSMKV